MNSSIRFASLDIFRGLTVALMIFVNSVDQHNGPSWFKHAAWNGCTVADLVFPFFIFILGISTYLSLQNAKNKFSPQALRVKIIKRSVFLFLIGLFLNAFPYFHLENLRFLGVLQRLALCYGLVSLFCLTLTNRNIAVVTILLLFSYWVLLIQLPLTPDNNFASFIDHFFLASSHLYTEKFDPEGLFSTISSLTTALFGVLLGAWLINRFSPYKKLTGIIILGLMFIALGWIWRNSLPFNKSLWTTSFVLWTTGLALLSFAFCYWIIEIIKLKAPFKPFILLGTLALEEYVLHIVVLKIQALVVVRQSESSQLKLRDWLTEYLFGSFPPNYAAIFYAISFTMLCFVIISFFNHCKNLYNKKTFLCKNL